MDKRGLKHGFASVLALTLAVAGTWGATSAQAYPSLGKFRNTYYMLALEKDLPHANKSSPVLDQYGAVIAKVSAQYKKKLDLEGSGKLMNGEVLNFKTRVNGQIRFEISKYEYGRGVGQCALDPFHTIAVDPAKIPLGSVVQIAETVGMVLPDGSKHNGLWKAEDIGGAIQADRIDLFVGEGDQGWVLDKAKITHLQALTVKLVHSPQTHSCADEAP